MIKILGLSRVPGKVSILIIVQLPSVLIAMSSFLHNILRNFLRIKVKEERKYLLKRLLHCQTDRPLEAQMGGGIASASPSSSSARFPPSQQSLHAILSNLTAQEGAAVVKAMDSNRKKQIAKLREKVKKKYAKKKTVKEVLEEQRRSDGHTLTVSETNKEMNPEPGEEPVV